MPNWKDPIVEEVRRIRKELEKEFENDAEGFHRETDKIVREKGLKYSNQKPIAASLEELKEKAKGKKSA